MAVVSVEPRFLSPATTVAESNPLLISVIGFTVDEDCIAVAINKVAAYFCCGKKVDKTIIISNS